MNFPPEGKTGRMGERHGVEVVRELLIGNRPLLNALFPG
jgi:hypothetical protein